MAADHLRSIVVEIPFFDLCEEKTSYSSLFLSSGMQSALLHFHFLSSGLKSEAAMNSFEV